MGILANTVSICQFRVEGKPPAENPAAWAAECLRFNAFQSIERGAEELSEGWVELDDPRQAGFPVEAVRRDHYLVFALRRDRRRVPAALLRGHMEEAEADFLAAHPGLQKVPRSKRAELKDAVRSALLARTLPVPSVHDAVWDLRSGLVFFTALGRPVVELFGDRFKQTFPGLRLVPVHPFARAEQAVDPELRDALQRANQASGEAVLELIEANRWLGRDLLLWLVHETLEGASEYAVCRPGPALQGEGFVAYLNDRFQLLGEGGEGLQKVTIAGPQVQFSELRAALQQGKELQEALLYLEKGEEVWRLNLKGETFQFASLRSPKVTLEKDELTDPGQERLAVFHERMGLLEEGLQLFDSLFAAFLRERLGPGWEARAAAIRDWLESG